MYDMNINKPMEKKTESLLKFKTKDNKVILTKKLENDQTRIKIVNNDNSKIQSVPSQEQLVINYEVAEVIYESDSSIESNMDTIQSTFIERLGSSQNTHDGEMSYKEKGFSIRKVLNSKTDSTTKVKQYTITTETIKQAIEEQSKEDSCAIDKYLNIVLRNLFGSFRNINLSYYDQQVNRVMKQWKVWYELKHVSRSTPLLYKCYQCYRGWWRLHPFREHLNEHKNVKLRTEQYKDEFCIYACSNYHDRKIVVVDSPCWRCGEDIMFHKIIDQSMQYSCKGCKRNDWSTCAKLKEHETVCTLYIAFKYKNVMLKDKIQCIICKRNYFEYKVYYEHLIDYHSVRSDDPIPIYGSVCKVCDGRYIIRKFHECPERVKGFRCSYCCRKFTVKALKNNHMQFYKDKIKCKVCGKCMRACMAPEHYLKHTNNYASAHICWGCENRVLFTKPQPYNAHMKHHITSSSNRRVGARMLFPKKCLNGEIVKSETILNIPNDHLNDFMLGLEGCRKDKPHEKRATVHNNNANIVNDTRLPKRRTENMEDSQSSDDEHQEMMNLDPETRAIQEQLDAEIMKDMQLEAAICEVFKASTSYIKLIEKEKMEQQIIKKESIKEEDMHEDGDSSDNDLVIVEAKEENVTLESESEDNIESIFEGELKSDSNEKESISDKETQENASDFEDDLKWIASSVAKERDMLKDIVRTDEVIQIDDESNQSNKTTEQKTIARPIKEMGFDQSEVVVSPKKEVQLDDDNNSIKETKEEIDIFKCSKCHFKGDWNQFVVHSITWCSAAVFMCKACLKFFPNFSHFLSHLVEHGHKQFSCPICKQIHKLYFTFTKHVTIHIRHIFSNTYIESMSEHSRNYYIFSCLKCRDNVELYRFFEHWQTHFNNELYNIASESDMGFGSTIKEVQLDDENNSTKKTKEELDIFKCSKCNFKGDWNQFVLHSITWCYAAVFKCKACFKCFPNLSLFLSHLVEHGHKQFSCPICKQLYKLSFTFNKHITIHIQDIFSKTYIKSMSERSRSYYIFSCLKCRDNVECYRFFEHWQTHYDNELFNVTSESDMKISSPQKEMEFDKLEVIASPKKEVQLDNDNSMKETKEELDIFICSKCYYKGDWDQFVLHSITWCSAAVFTCKACYEFFPNLSQFLSHLVDHGHKQFSCPLCKHLYKLSFAFNKHVTTHIRQMFSQNYIESMSERSRNYYIFSCLKCHDNVELNRIFEHWQTHFDNELFDVTSETDMDIDTTKTEIEHINEEVEISDEENNEMSKTIDIEEIDYKAETSETKNESVKLTNGLYKCKDCHFDMNLKQYLIHCIALCSDSEFGCNKCHKNFENLQHYLDHLAVHGKRNICPMCGLEYLRQGSLCRHVTSHILNNFSTEYMQDPGSHTQNFVAACSRCDLKVEINQFFGHWIAHIDVASQMEIDHSGADKKSDDLTEGNGMSKAIPKNELQIAAHNTRKPNTNKCQNCDFEGDWKQYIMHIARCAATDLKCNICDRKFGGMQAYVDHLQDHGYKNLTCPICDRLFEYSSSLTTHLTYHIIDSFSKNSKKVLHLKDFPLTCSQCGNHIKLEELFTHWQHHFGIDRERNRYQKSEFYEAKMIIMSPDTIEKVLQELRNRTREPYELHCDVCHEEFELENRYKVHMIGHLLTNAKLSTEYRTRKRLKCNFCGSFLYKSVQWKLHMFKHSDMPVYQCDKCPKVFSDSSNLSRHEKIHERILICDICDGKFSTKHSLVKHFKDNRCDKTSTSTNVADVKPKRVTRLSKLRERVRNKNIKSTENVTASQEIIEID